MTVQALFEKQVKQRPDSIAITFDGEQLSYADLNTRSNQLAHALIGMGLKPNQPVAIMLEDGPKQILSLFGVIKAGGVIVCLDTAYPEKRLRFIFGEIHPHVVITENACLDGYRLLFAESDDSGHLILNIDANRSVEDRPVFSEWQRYTGSLERFPGTNPKVTLNPADPVYIVYTSGSTGEPKGILQSHSSFLQFIEWQSSQFGITCPQRFAQWASIAYDAGYRQIFGSLCFGATLCMAPASVRYNPSALVDWINSEKVTLLNVVPSFCWEFIGAVRGRLREGNDRVLEHLRTLILTGENLPVDLARTWLNLIPDPPRLFNMYGPSECILATCQAVETVPVDTPSVPIGRAIGGREILILDENHQPCPVGVAGEIFIRSGFLTLGYFKRPQETEKAFLQNPLHDDFQDPVYRTGDLGCWRQDGAIEFSGRMDNQVKLHGIRVELGDIESALREYDGVRSCAAIVQQAKTPRRMLVAKERKARPDSAQIAHQVLVAYFTSGHDVSWADWNKFLSDKLPSHMIPQHFVRLEGMPVNANGKLDRRALSNFDYLRLEQKTPYAEPATARQKVLAQIWQEILGVDHVGINDSFFALGGDSLIAMQIINRIRQTINVRLSFRDLFENQTIAKLAMLEEQSTEDPAALPGTRQDDTERADYPLTLAQQGIWFLWQLEPDSPYYTGQGTIHLRGPIQLPVFQHAWNNLLDRNLVLRVNFSMRDGVPVQSFRNHENAELPVTDLSGLPQDKQRSAIEEMAKKKAKRALNLEHDLLLQAHLFKLSESEHEVLLTFHEIILDLWGISLMIRDLGAVYAAIAENAEPPASTVLSFGAYALWEAEHIQRRTLRDRHDYWRNQLAGELPVLNLPTDRPRPASPSYRGAGKSIFLDTSLSRRLKSLSLEQDSTLFMTLLTAFNIFLHHYTGQDDLIVGAPISNRSQGNSEDLVGFFLNMLPLRTRIENNPEFVKLLKRVSETVSNAICNADYPFMWMVEESAVARDLSITPVFQVMFNMLNLPHESISFGDLDVSYNEIETSHIKYDLCLYAQEQGDCIFLQLAYLTDLFDGNTISRMLNNFVVLLGNIVERPGSPLSEIPMLGDTEKDSVLGEFNNTYRDFGDHQCIHQLFEKQALETPNSTALICQGQRLDYTRLNEQSNQLAHFLKSRGVENETIVALCIERSFESIITLLAIMKAGGTYVALDPDYPLTRLEDILSEIQPAVLIVQGNTDRFEEFSGNKVNLDLDRHLIENQPESNPVCAGGTDRLLNIVYTSSSTGKPKGVAIAITSVLNRLFWMWEDYPFQADDVALLQKSTSLVAATWECFGALLKGLPTVIVTRDTLLDPAELWKELAGNRVSYLLASPPILEGVLEQAEIHPGDWNSARLVTTSTEAVSPALVARWYNSFPRVPLLNLYGSTECSSNVTAYDTRDLPSDAIRVPVGKPLPNINVYVLDEYLNPCAIGVTGELHVSGTCVARGYFRQPGLTESQFVPDPFCGRTGSVLYKTGDLARRRPDGNIELVGRKDLQVKIRGFRVEPGDIEAALSAHGGVRKCAVAVCQDHTGRNCLAAFVVTDGDVSATALRGHLHNSLPDYMIPSDYVFLDSIPLTPNGKIDRQALPEPDRTRTGQGENHRPPVTALEQVVADIWSQILNLEKLGLDDNFFDLGGHSLHATQTISRLREIFELELPVRNLFETPTVAGLVDTLSDQCGGREKAEAIALTLKHIQQLSDDELMEQLVNDENCVKPPQTRY